MKVKKSKLKKKKFTEPVDAEPRQTPRRRFLKVRNSLKDEEEYRRMISAHQGKIMLGQGKDRVLMFLKGVMEGTKNSMRDRLRAAEILLPMVR